MVNYPCPPADRWQALLHDALPAAESTGLHRHLEGCPACQRALEECAAGRDVWAGTRGLGQPTPPSDPSLRAVIDRLKAGPETAPAAEIAMDADILDPPVAPGALGRLNIYDVLEEI